MFFGAQLNSTDSNNNIFYGNYVEVSSGKQGIAISNSGAAHPETANNNIFKKSLNASLQFNEAIDKVPEFNTVFTDNWLSNNFKMIAKVIAAREELGFSRQIFFIDYGGWDMHDELLNAQM